MAVINGDDNPNAIAGGSENDSINGRGGNDTLEGGTGSDTLRGGGGDDQIHGYRYYTTGDSAVDQLFGDAGNDFITIGTGDSADGGTGNDTIEAGDDHPLSVIGGSGTDTLRVGGHIDIAGTSISGFERLEAATSSYGTQLTAAQFSSFGSIGAIGGGATVGFELTGGGTGVLTLESPVTTVYIGGSDAASQISFAVGTTANVDFTGGAGAENVRGGNGNDTLEGGTGSDTLRGGGGDDQIHGYRYYTTGDSAVDQLFGDAGNDFITIGTGDSADGGTGNDTIEAGDDHPLSVIGGSGTDTLRVGGHIDIAGTSISGFERLEAATSSYGTQLTAAQFSSFGSIGAIGGGATVGFELTGGGTGVLTLESPVTTVYIGGSDAASQISFAVGTTANVDFTGGAGAENVRGGNGNDTLEGGTGSDTLRGGGGDDQIHGYRYYTTGDSAVDQLFGDAGNDFITIGTGDSADGGTGNDTIEAGDDHPLSVIGGSGTDTLRVGGHIDIAGTSISGFERLEAATSSYGTQLTAAQFSSFGSIGAIGGGATVGFELTGGGTGVLTLESPVTTVYIGGSDAASQISFAVGTTANVDFTGGAGAENVRGGNGNDTLEGGTGSDTLRGGGGDDQIHGYRYYTTGDSAVDQLFGDDGNDLITLGTGDLGDGGAGNDTIIGSSGNETMTGGSGSDTASYEESYLSTYVNLNFTVAQNTGGGGVDLLTQIENLIGGTGDDTLQGTSGANILEGNRGDDVLYGAAGNDTASYAHSTSAVAVDLRITAQQNTLGAGLDTLSSLENLIGGGGNDTLTGTGAANIIEGGVGNDTINGLGGTDTVSYSGASGPVVVSLAITVLQNTLGAGLDILTDNENLRGSAFDDQLTGNAAANLIEGLDGADTLDGGAGSDTLVGGNGNDRYIFGAGDTLIEAETATGGIDRVQTATSFTLASAFEHLTLTESANINGTGNANANSMSGNTGANLLTGLGGNDTLIGGTGSDTLNGGAGTDRLDGGENNDTFIFSLTSESSFAAPDTIVSFEGAGAAAGDRIDLSAIDANTDTGGNAAFTFNSIAAGGLSIVASGTDTLIRGNTDSDSAFDFALLITDGGTGPGAYTAADFIL